MTTHATPAPSARRRASTLAQQERILDMATGLPLTKSVLRQILDTATCTHLDLIETWFGLELDQRAQSRKVRLLRQASFPTTRPSTTTTGAAPECRPAETAPSSKASSSSTTPRTSSSTATSDAARPTWHVPSAGSRASTTSPCASSPPQACSCDYAAPKASTGSTRNSPPSARQN